MNSQTGPAVAAVLAAAGRSSRMGTPKQLLAWGQSTVLATVIGNHRAAGVAPIVCVVGHARDEVARVAGEAGAQVVFNAAHAEVEMLASYQLGIRHLQETQAPVQGALVSLGDQPHVPVWVIRQVIHHALCRPQAIVIPSYRMRRGHPIYLPRGMWPRLLALGPADSLRTLLHSAQDQIEHVNVASESILLDMDTPEDYAARRAASMQES